MIKSIKTKQILSFLILAVLVVTLLCGSAFADPSEHGKKPFSGPGVHTVDVTRMQCGQWIDNGGKASTQSTTSKLMASSANFSNAAVQTFTAKGPAAQNSSQYSNTPYTCTFYVQIYSTNTSGQFALWY